MSKKIVIKADPIGKACKSEILAIVATIQGIKSMDIDAEKCTLTVVGIVDPVRIVRKLRKKCFAACIVTVEDDKPKEEKTDPCKEAKEKLEKAYKEYCEKCKPSCCTCSCPAPCPPPCPPCVFPPSNPCSFPPNGCHHPGMWPPPPPVGWCYEERYPGHGGECVIQ